MAGIPEIEGMSVAQVREQIERGGRFVVFDYVISLLLITFKRSSRVFFVRHDESALVKSLPYNAVSFALGWWGIPWGLIRTPMALLTNLSGGRDVTAEVWRG